MRNEVLVTLAFTLFLSIHGKSQESRSAVITIANKTNHPLNLYYHDQFYRGNPLFVNTDEVLQFNMVTDTSFIIIANSLQHFYKVTDKDTLVFGPDSHVVTKGADSNINFALDYLYSQGIQLRLNEFKKRDLSSYTSYKQYLMARNAEWQHVKELCSTITSLDTPEMREVQEYISAAYYASIFRPDVLFRFTYKDSLSADFPRLQKEFFSELPFKAAMPNSLAYQLYVECFSGAHASLKTMLENIAAHVPERNLRGDLSAIYIARNLESLQQTQVKLMLDEFIDKEDTKRSLQKMYNSITASKDISAAGNPLYNLNEKKLKLESILSEKKGKLIYIDTWASWCVPCLSEMKHYPALLKKYQQKIDFIFLSVDADIKQWMSAALRITAMTPDNSFLLAGGFGSRFASSNKIIAIPRYFLIGRSGKIMYADAPRPGDARLRDILDKLINNE